MKNQAERCVEIVRRMAEANVRNRKHNQLVRALGNAVLHSYNDNINVGEIRNRFNFEPTPEEFEAEFLKLVR